MAKKTIMDDLISAPWWVSLILAAVTYIFLKFWLPSAEFTNPGFLIMAGALPPFAGFAASIFILTAAVSTLHSWRKGKLIERQNGIDSIRNLSWKDFEYLVSEAFKRKGYSVSENPGSGPDGGVDLVLEKRAEKTLVQCKNWKSSKVSVSVVRELFGVVTAEGASKGILVCSGGYTRDAVNFGRNNNIELMDGTALSRLIAAVQTKPQMRTVQEDTACPACGSPMLQRVAKKGKNAGTSFLGCSQFPKCRGTRENPVQP